MTLSLTSPAFGDGDAIPHPYTCDGADMSVPLAWHGVPDGTRSLALLCDDPDAPRGTWHHWAIFDLAPDTAGLPEGVGEPFPGARQAVNDFGRPGYGGPCPPPGHGPHRYQFRLLALAVGALDVGARPGCVEVAQAARPHVLAEALLVGTYER